jgi:FdhD protein
VRVPDSRGEGDSDQGAPVVELEREIVTAEGRTRRHDVVAREEPMELRVQGAAVTVVMRTPGHDFALAVGALVGEGIVRAAADVVRVRHCDRVERPEAEDNVVEVTLRDVDDTRMARLRRGVAISASCGTCGKTSLEQLEIDAPVWGEDVLDVALPTRMVLGLPLALRERQSVFASTGGLHAAGLFDAAGSLLIVHEDVGRHNAVDKVNGARVLAHAGGPDRLGTEGLGLVVSGRVSFEIVQKAAYAGLHAIVAVSAPTSLAVETARARGIALLAFVREGRFVAYAGAERLVGAG